MNPALIFTLIKTGLTLIASYEKEILAIPILGRVFWLLWMPIKGLVIVAAYAVGVAICLALAFFPLVLVAGMLEGLIEGIVGDPQFHQNNQGVVWSLTFGFWTVVVALFWRWRVRRRKRAVQTAS